MECQKLIIECNDDFDTYFVHKFEYKLPEINSNIYSKCLETKQIMNGIQITNDNMNVIKLQLGENNGLTQRN